MLRKLKSPVGAGTLRRTERGNDVPDNISELVRLISQPKGYVVLTGEFSCSDRMEAMNIFTAMGLSVSGAVSSKTSFILTGNGYKQAKIDRALSLGIPVFSENEFWAAVDIVFPSDQK